jgi:hypothetical protein
VQLSSFDLRKRWRYLADPLTRVKDAVDLIADALLSVDISESPRLTCDLLFVRARLLENVGIWQPSAYESAAEDYASGLAVPNVKHELEARGMALTDYANTLSRLPKADEEENDRLHGEHGANQERALAMVQEAIDLIEQARQEEFAEDNDLVLRTLASAYLAKSNIIRKREFGDEYAANSAARDALRTAEDRLRSGRDDQLRGIFYLNLGHVNLCARRRSASSGWAVTRCFRAVGRWSTRCGTS